MDHKIFEYSNHREYYVNGQLHRADGPAIEYANGDKEYWVNGSLHRTDGPAIETKNEHHYNNEYWLCGKEYSYEDWLRLRKLVIFL